MSGARVLAAVPNWNGGDLTLDCLRSLSRVGQPAIAVAVIDNGSADRSVAAVRASFPSVPIVELGENTGFTGAANAALARAREQGSEYCLLLNSDAVIAEDAIALLVEALDRMPAAWVAGPTVYYLDPPQVIWSA